MSMRFSQRFLSQQNSVTAGLSWPDFFASQATDAKHALLRDFYAAGVPDPSTPMAEAPLVAIDFETTGLDARKCDIVSIGIVPMSLERIYSRQGAHWIVRPRTPLSEESVVFHGITHSDIDAAEDLEHQLEEILDHLKGKVVIAHCCSIERNFLDQAVKARWGEGVLFPMLDTMAIEQTIVRQPGFIERLFGGERKSLRLADCRERYGLPFYHPHHAQSDALACGELFQAQFAHHFKASRPVRDFWW